MRQLSVLVACAIGLMVAGCVTVANNLKPEELRSFKLTEVTVGFDEAPVIAWDQGLKDYAAANGMSLFEVMSKGNTAPLQQYLRDQLVMRIKSALERDLRGWMDGTRPVRLEIVV